jgi:beta-N-acetylglucosaminidase
MTYSIRIILTILAMIALSYLAVERSFAAEKVSRTSARLALQQEAVKDNRVEILERYLKKYNSPFAGSARTFVEEADKNNIDWKLVVSIAGVESYFGKHIPYNSNNAWGWGVYGNNVQRFASWDEGITEISYELKTRYMDKWGAKDVYEIGSYYAADPRWANKVTHFMNDLEEFEKEQDKKMLSISL